MATIIIATFSIAVPQKEKGGETNKCLLRLCVSLVWMTTKLARRATSVNTVRAVEIRTARIN